MDKVLSWFCRGLNSGLKRKNLKVFMRKHDPYIVILQETKFKGNESDLKLFLDLDNCFDIISSPAVGLSGGLATIWNTDKVSVLGYQIHRNWIWFQMSVLLYPQYISFSLINIYGPHKMPLQRLLWQQLSDILASQKGQPCCVMGDFNGILSENEKQNCLYRHGDIKMLRHFMDNNSLVDISLKKYDFNWFGPQNRCSKLDRVVVSLEWIEKGKWKLEGVGRKASDHVAIYFYAGGI